MRRHLLRQRQFLKTHAGILVIPLCKERQAVVGESSRSDRVQPRFRKCMHAMARHVCRPPRQETGDRDATPDLSQQPTTARRGTRCSPVKSHCAARSKRSPRNAARYRRAARFPKTICSSTSAKTVCPKRSNVSSCSVGTTRMIVYSFMYGPDRDRPCRCTHLLDSMDGGARHIDERASLCVAKSPISAPCRVGARAALESSFVFSRRPAIATTPTISATPRSCRRRYARRAWHEGRRGLGQETMFNVFRFDSGSRSPALLGRRAHLGAGGRRRDLI